MSNNSKESYREFIKYENDSVTNYKTSSERIQKINANFKLCEAKLKEIDRNISILSLFIKTTLETEEFYEDFNVVKGYVDRCKGYFKEALNRKPTVTVDSPSGSIVDMFYEVSDLLDALTEVSKEVKSFEAHYYPKMKMTTYNAIKNLSNSEIDKLTKDVNSYIETFDSLTDASDFISYNSGDLVVSTVAELISELKKNRALVKINLEKEYFLASDVILFMDLIDWINLFSRLQYVFERVDKALYKSEKLDGMLNDLLIRYLVVLINNEKRSV